MDLLDDYLAGVRARGAVFCSTVSTPPWGLRFTGPAPLALVAPPRGNAWIVPDDDAPVQVRQGGVALVRIQHPYTVADQPDSAPQVLVDGNDHCTLTASPGEHGHNWRMAGRTLGQPATSHTDLLITASYRIDGDLSAPLLDALPPIAVLQPDDTSTTDTQPHPGPAALLDLIATEVEHDAPGQQVVLDRFLDLILVRTLRAWFDRPDTAAPTGYRALADPDIGHVLRRVHEDPARPWTLASLASEAAMSRTTFVRRFSTLVGRPPLAYVTDWRMALAADRLRAPGSTIATVAQEVGYADAFAFSTAFKRVRGISPSTHRVLNAPQASVGTAGETRT